MAGVIAIKIVFTPVFDFKQTRVRDMRNYVQNNNGKLEQLKQLVNATWDGDLICKRDTKELREQGFVTSWNGFSVVTKEGLKLLTDLNLMHG